MIIVFAFCQRDEDQALKNATWWQDLGELKNHEALVTYDPRCNPDKVEAIGEAVRKVFGRVWRLQTEAQIDGWPQGANYFFARSCTWLQGKPQYPYFFWLEPDAVPTREGWLDKLEAEYRRGGKPFMGERVDLGTKRPDVPVHMSGVGFYESPIYKRAGEAYRAGDVAWDIAAKDQILPNAYFTTMIQHYWQHGTFTSLEGLRPETIVFHSSKDGSLIDLLRQKRHDDLFPVQGGAEEARLAHNQEVAGSIPAPATIKILPHNGVWVLDGDTIISDQVERNGRLDFDPLLPHITSFIRPGDTVIDVGAFIGDHTVAYSVSVGDKGKVVAYEPNPLAFQCLVHNTDKLGNVFTFCHALGAEVQVVELTDLPNAASNYIGAGGRHVHVRTLDGDMSFFGKVDLIKIDVEGYELNVLKGAEKLVEKFHPKMVIEINEEALARQGATRHDIVGWLFTHGYESYVLYRHPGTPFYDILAEPVGATEEPAQSTSPYVHDNVPPPQAPALPDTYVSRQSIATPKEEMIEAIAFLKAYSELSNTNKAVVGQRLVAAGLRPRSKKKK